MTLSVRNNCIHNPRNGFYEVCMYVYSARFSMYYLCDVISTINQVFTSIDQLLLTPSVLCPLTVKGMKYNSLEHMGAETFP